MIFVQTFKGWKCKYSHPAGYSSPLKPPFCDPSHSICQLFSSLYNFLQNIKEERESKQSRERKLWKDVEICWFARDLCCNPCRPHDRALVSCRWSRFKRWGPQSRMDSDHHLHRRQRLPWIYGGMSLWRRRSGFRRHGVRYGQRIAPAYLSKQPSLHQLRCA